MVVTYGHYCVIFRPSIFFQLCTGPDHLPDAKFKLLLEKILNTGHFTAFQWPIKMLEMADNRRMHYGVKLLSLHLPEKFCCAFIGKEECSYQRLL